MSKFISILTAFALMLTLTPMTVAHKSPSHKKALTIKSASVETDRQKVKGEITVCNNTAERIKFNLDVQNLTINHLYKRKLAVAGAKCTTVDLKFTKNFAEMSNTGDEIQFVAKSVKGLVSFGKYALSDPYIAFVAEGNTDEAGCGDAKGGDQIYSVCPNDFIYHEPSGLRIKVQRIDRRKVDLLLTHIRWGGVKKLRVYKDRNKTVHAGDDGHTKVEINNLVGENRHDFLLEISSN